VSVVVATEQKTALPRKQLAVRQIRVRAVVGHPTGLQLLPVLVVAVYLLSVLSYQPASQTQPLLLLVEL
jgi:hypothetical protein